MGPRTDLEKAIVRRLIEYWPDVELSEVDCDGSFLEPTGFCFGHYILDSLDIVEVVVTLEVDLNVAIMTENAMMQFDTIAKLGELIGQKVDPTQLASFEDRWAAVREEMAK